MIYSLLSISILLTVSAQLLLKKGVLVLNKSLSANSNIWEVLMSSLKNLYLIGGLFLWGLAFICWLFILSKIKMSVAYPLANALNISLVVLGSVLFFKEDFSLLQFLGILLIIGGIFMLWRP